VTLLALTSKLDLVHLNLDGGNVSPNVLSLVHRLLAGRFIMATKPSGLTKVIVGFFDLFSKRAWPLVHVLLAGAILTVGPRTVTAVLRVMGLSQEKQFQKYHRVLNRVKWSALAASRGLLGLLVDAFAPDGPLLMALDDTIERRRGAKIAAKVFTVIPCARATAISSRPAACAGCA
jgi:hypothetical protein